MSSQRGFFDVEDCYARLSEAGDPLERLNSAIDWELFCKPLSKALKHSDRSKGGRQPSDAVMMFKIRVLQVLYNLSDDQISDRPSFMRFLGLGLEDKVPDAKTIRLYLKHGGDPNHRLPSRTGTPFFCMLP